MLGGIMSSKEIQIYFVLMCLAYLAFNVGMIIFSTQHVITTVGPDKYSLDPIYFTGMVVYTICSIATIVFVVFRMKDK